VIAVGLVAVVVTGLWAYTRLIPPSGGRHRVVLYHNGFVDSVPGQPPLAMRWDEIVSVAYDLGVPAMILRPAGFMEDFTSPARFTFGLMSRR
jgi:hypothetical protein